MKEFSYDKLREKLKNIYEQEQMVMNDDDWKLVTEGLTKPEKVSCTIPVDAKAIKHLTQAYEKLENQIIGLAQLMQKVPVIEDKVRNTEKTILNTISTAFNDTFGKDLTDIITDATMNVIKSKAMIDTVSKLCVKVVNKAICAFLDGDELTAKIIQICSQYSSDNSKTYTALISKLNDLINEIDNINQRISRLEKGDHDTWGV